jgi:type I restriction enzyme, S subunit
MNAERVLALYDKVAEAPDAIARLRRFVLDLAVRGKLVAQDPRDEPASDLLKRIAAEKARLVQAGEIKRPKPVDPVIAPGSQFLPPHGWTWTQLADIAVCLDYMREPINGTERDKRIEGKSKDELYPYYGATQQQGWIDDYIFDEELVLLGEDGVPFFDPYRTKAYLIRGRAWVNNHAHVFKGILISHSFLAHYLNVFDYTGRVVGATRSKLNQARAVDIPIPLPPLAEQRRIVAKVEELMALLDRLEAARTAREATRDRLTAASLARLTAPDADPTEFPANARFALATLPALTTRPDQIKPLRQTILNLAVRGKLVEQDPTDEPASELLRRIAKAKAAAKRETGDARIKPAPSPEPDTMPMDLPSGWSAESFENLFLFIDYRGKTPTKTTEGIPLITAKNVRMGSLNREPREFIAERTFRAWMTRGFPQVGDLFFTTEAPLANICLNDIEEPFALAQRVICFQPYAGIDTRYLMFAIMSDVVQGLIDKHSTGLTAKGIKAAKLKPLPLPIPPLAEQHRIVANVDALTALCDRLEAALTTADTTRARLLEALLHEALVPQGVALEAAE